MGIKTIGLSILGVSTAGGMAAGGYFFMQPKNIKDLLIQDKLNPLDISETSKDEDKWGELVKLHKGKVDPINLKNSITVKLLVKEDIRQEEATGIKKLKDECKKLFEKKITNTKDTDKESAKNWCTEESPLLKKENLPPLSKPLASASEGPRTELTRASG